MVSVRCQRPGRIGACRPWAGFSCVVLTYVRSTNANTSTNTATATSASPLSVLPCPLSPDVLLLSFVSLARPQVTFTHAAHFAGNRAAVAAAFGKGGGGATVSSSSVSVSSAAKSGPSLPTSPWRHRDVDRRPCGGAVSVGKSGRISFWEFASFEDNYSAGRGGAVCNRGWVKLFRRSFFNGNQAAGGESGRSTEINQSEPWLTHPSTVLCREVCVSLVQNQSLLVLFRSA